MIQNFIISILKLCILFCLVQTLVTNLIYQFIDVSTKIQSEAYAAKFEYIKKNINKYDTILVGSSMTIHGVNTDVFNKNSNLKAYNFGVQTYLMPRSLLILEDLLYIIKDSKIKHIFIELNPLALIDKQYEDEKYYFVTNFWFDYQTCMLKESSNNCLEQTFYGALRKFFTSSKILFQKKKINDYWFKEVSQHSGYQTLTDNPKSPQNSRIEFLKANKQIYISEKPPLYRMKTNEHSFFNYFKTLLQKYRDQGIEIIFYNPPSTSLTDIHWYYDEFLKETQYPFLEISRTKYPNLFNGELFFDISHLNKNGAILFADILSKSYINLKKDQNS